MIGNIIPVHAAGSYKISFKAGSKGNFADGKTNYTVQKAYKESVLGDVAEATAQIQNSIEGSGYYFTRWSPEINEYAERRADYVAQYARIIDEAVYRINYRDTYGNEVATQKVISANLNAEVTAYAEAVEGYTVDAASKTAVIKEKNGTEITFIYTIIPNYVTEEKVETVHRPGTPGGNHVGTGLGMAGDNQEAIGDTNEENVSDKDQTEISENPSKDKENQNDVTIEDEEVPLNNKSLFSNQTGIYVGMGIILLALVVTVVYFPNKKQLRK